MSSRLLALPQIGVPPGYHPPPTQPMSFLGCVVLFALAALTLVALWAASWWSDQDDPKSLIETRLAAALVVRSARLAGSRNSHLAVDWTADLAGTPEQGRLLSPEQKLRYGYGCLAAAVRLRSGDVVDDILTSRARSNTVAGGPVVLAAVLLVRREGLMGPLLHAESLTCVGGSAVAVVRALRRWRGVKPAPGRRGREGRS